MGRGRSPAYSCRARLLQRRALSFASPNVAAMSPTGRAGLWAILCSIMGRGGTFHAYLRDLECLIVELLLRSA